MTQFIRTKSGLVAKFLFFREPLVWVEGPTDIPIYDQILRSRNCRIESAGGKSECIKLADALIQLDLPYIVVIDGDYEILQRKRSKHRRIILLNRHSIENYLFEEKPINNICCKYSSIVNQENLIAGSFSALIQTIDTELLDLMVIDVAHNRAGTEFKPFPDTHLTIIDSREDLSFDSDRIAELCQRFEMEVDREAIAEAEWLINEFVKDRRFVDLIKGHFIFGILRDLFYNMVREETGKAPNIDNKGLRVLMAIAVWEYMPNSDHISLKRRLFRAISEVIKMRTSWH